MENGKVIHTRFNGIVLLKGASILAILLILSCGMPPKEKALSILKDGIQDQSIIIRVSAAKGLKEIGDPRGAEVFDEVLKSKNEEGIVAVLSALYDLKEKVCPPVILELCKNDDPLVRAEAYKLVAVSADERCREILIKGTEDKIAKIRRVSYLGLEKYNEKRIINDGLRDIDPFVRIAAARTLGKLGEKGMENFIKNELKKINPEVLIQGFIALAEMSDTSSISNISQFLTDTPWDLRLAAAEALLILNDLHEFEILEEGLKANDPFVRAKTVEILKKYPIPALYDMLREATKDEYVNVSVPAIDALQGYQKKESLSLYEKLMDAPNPLLKIAAAKAYLKSL